MSLNGAVYETPKSVRFWTFVPKSVQVLDERQKRVTRITGAFHPPSAGHLALQTMTKLQNEGGVTHGGPGVSVCEQFVLLPTTLYDL